MIDMDMMGFNLDKDLDSMVESSQGENSMGEDLGAEHEIVCMQIEAIDDPEDERLPELIKKRRMLERKIRTKQKLKRIKEDIQRLSDDEFDDMSMIPIRMM